MSEYIVKGTTKSGFEYQIDKRKLEDRKLVRVVSQMLREGAPEGEVIAATFQYQNMILGDAQETALEEHIRGLHDGYCSQEQFNDELLEITNAVKEIKN